MPAEASRVKTAEGAGNEVRSYTPLHPSVRLKSCLGLDHAVDVFKEVGWFGHGTLPRVIGAKK